MNFLIFLALVIPLHPRVGWIDYRTSVLEWTTAQVFVAGLAFVQLLSVLLNLVPVPPLDGFGAIAPYLPEDVRFKLTNPPWNYTLFFIYFLALNRSPQLMGGMVRTIFHIIEFFGIEPVQCYYAFQRCVYGDQG
jgi:Zn-dependent protease